MKIAVDIQRHPDFTVEQILAATGFHLPSPVQQERMRQALAYFQRVVPRAYLRMVDDAGPLCLSIHGIKIKLLNWLQAIDYRFPLNVHRAVQKGNPLIAYHSATAPTGHWGKWYTYPSTKQPQVAIHSSHLHMRKFKARQNFVCLQSTASDAYVGWVRDVPPEYRAGGATQLFIWEAHKVLDPA